MPTKAPVIRNRSTSSCWCAVATPASMGSAATPTTTSYRSTFPRQPAPGGRFPAPTGYPAEQGVRRLARRLSLDPPGRRPGATPPPGPLPARRPPARQGDRVEPQPPDVAARRPPPRVRPAVPSGARSCAWSWIEIGAALTVTDVVGGSPRRGSSWTFHSGLRRGQSRDVAITSGELRLLDEAGARPEHRGRLVPGRLRRRTAPVRGRDEQRAQPRPHRARPAVLQDHGDQTRREEQPGVRRAHTRAGTTSPAGRSHDDRRPKQVAEARVSCRGGIPKGASASAARPLDAGR